MIEVSCSNCGRTYHTEEHHLGRAIRCVGCGSVITLARPQDSTSQPEVEYRRPSTPTSSPRSKGSPFRGIKSRFSPKALSRVVALLVFGTIAFFAGRMSNPSSLSSAPSTAASSSGQPSTQPSSAPKQHAPTPVQFEPEKITPTPNKPASQKSAKRLRTQTKQVLTVPEEISAIRAGRHAQLPQGEGSPAELGGQTVINVQNSTGYELYFYISGPTSRQITLSAGVTRPINIPPGSYDVAAKVSDPRVTPFYGRHNYAANAEYSEQLYIVTSLR
jgi:DNA-directed RNA polymerase subunit RPC12/RpoP